MISEIYFTCAYAIEKEMLKQLEEANKNTKFIFLDPNKYDERANNNIILAMQKWVTPHLMNLGYKREVIIEDFDIINFSITRLEKLLSFRKDFRIISNIDKKIFFPIETQGEVEIKFIVCKTIEEIEKEMINCHRKVIITDLPYNAQNVLSFPDWHQISNYKIANFKLFLREFFNKSIDICEFIDATLNTNKQLDIREYFHKNTMQICYKNCADINKEIKYSGNYIVEEKIMYNKKGVYEVRKFFPLSTLIRSRKFFNNNNEEIRNEKLYTNNPHNIYNGKRLLNAYLVKNELKAREYSNIGEELEEYTFISYNCIASFVRNYLNMEHSGPSGYWGMGSDFDIFTELLLEGEKNFLKSLYITNPSYRVYNYNTEMGVLDCNNSLSWYFNHHINLTELEIKELYNKRIIRKKKIKPFYIIGLDEQATSYFTKEKVIEILSRIKNIAFFCQYDIDDDRVFHFKGDIKQVKTSMKHFGNCDYEDILRFKKIVQRCEKSYSLGSLLSEKKYEVDNSSNVRAQKLKYLGSQINDITFISHSCEAGFANQILNLEQKGPTSFLWSDYKLFYDEIIKDQKKFIKTLYFENPKCGKDNNLDLHFLHFSNGVRFYYNHHKHLNAQEIEKLYSENLKKEKSVKPFYLFGIDKNKIEISDDYIIELLKKIPNIIIFTNKDIKSDRIINFPIIKSDGEYNSMFFFKNAPLKEIEKVINIIIKSEIIYTL